MSNGKQPKAGTEQRRSVQKEARDYRRYIEESFPVKEVGEISAYEKNIRHGHISTMHIWWARRPLAASRATAYAALTPVPKDAEEWQKKRDFIIQLCQWENSTNPSLLERARREILEANGGVPPKVLDPFSGGGSYPLEALRLGCESYANDYNPVAVLIEKAMLEYPQKFRRPFEGMPDWAKPQTGSQKTDDKKKKKGKDEQPDLFDPTTGSEPSDFNPLLNAVRYWSDWVLAEARKELDEFYPSDSDKSIPIGYIWARTIPCQNPSCGEEIPLMRQFWISKKAKRKIALYPKVSKGKLEFLIVGDGYETWPKDFDPEKGTVSRAVPTCPVCGTVIDNNTSSRLFKEGKSSQKIMVAISKQPTRNGKNYRLPNSKDLAIYKLCREKIVLKQQELIGLYGFDPIPFEPISETMPGGLHTPAYGMNTWGSLYNDRQLLAMITFLGKIRKAYELMIESNATPEFAKAITTYLGLGLDELARFNTSINPWSAFAEAVVHIFGRQSISMMWDYIENNPIGSHGGTWEKRISDIMDVVNNICNANMQKGFVSQGSATNMPWSDNYFDAVFTDPPYYYSVTYADLSDFFYVWLSRSVGHLYPDLFSTPLSPKNNEIIEKKFWDKTSIQDSAWYEGMLRKALQEVYRVLKENGLAIIVYAHKTTTGWETLINALLDSGLVVTSSWPVNTEHEGRLMAQESAALASSIYIVARKMPRQSTGFYNDVRAELTQYLDTKLHRLWEEGIGGGDFFIAAIGSAIEIFGKYEQVMDFEGNIVRANRLLEEVRVIATNYAVKQILHDEFVTEVSPIARFYVLWRWNYGEALVPFDEANKLAHSCGLDLSLQFGKNGFIKKEKQFARLLGPQGRKLDDLDDPRDMIDVLHKTLLLWEKGQRAEMVKALADRGFGKSEAFYRVAQAISETLPLESKEKKLLDGFLAGRDRVQQEVEKSAEQGKLL